MKRIINTIVYLGVTYPAGILLWSIFSLLKLLKRIQILHWERFPHWQGNIILVSNHPSLVEPLLLPVLFFREFFFHPFRFKPWSTPDKKNYYDPWYWFWIRPVSIPIDRTDKIGELKTLFKMRNTLKSGGVLILFPEGGRTFKGEEFLYSEKGNRIRILKEGVGWLVMKTKPLVIPVWVEGSDKMLPNLPDKLYHTFPRIWRKTIIKIGNPLKFGNPDGKEEVTQKLAITLLNLADEEE